jgi:hypothetical protein
MGVTFATQTAQASAIPATGVAASGPSMDTVFQWAGHAVTAGQVAEFMYRHGVGPKESPDVDGLFHAEVAKSALAGVSKYYVKVCRENGQEYGVPSSAKACLDGSPPLMLERPIDPSKLTDPISGG